MSSLPKYAWPGNTQLLHHVDWDMAHLHHGCRKTNTTGMDSQRALTCSPSLVSQLQFSCWGYVLRQSVWLCRSRGWWTVWHLTLEEGELYMSTVASISRSPTGLVMSSVLQLDPLGSCSLLLLVKCWSFPFPQVSKFSGICLCAFGHAEILGTDHQIKRSEVSCLCSGAESLCTLLIWKMQGTADVTNQTLCKG